MITSLPADKARPGPVTARGRGIGGRWSGRGDRWSGRDGRWSGRGGRAHHRRLRRWLSFRGHKWLVTLVVVGSYNRL